MRTETNLLEGTTVVLERPSELGGLRAPLRRLVTPAVRALFEGFPGSVEALAAKSTSRAVGASLARLARAPLCEVEIHRPGALGGGAAEAYVRLGDPPVLLSGDVGRLPARCPAALAEVLRLVGVVRAQYGGALGLLRPSAQRCLADLASEYDRYYPGALADLPMPATPRAFHAIYEDSGAYVCASPAGDTWRFSLCGGDYGPGPPVTEWIDAFFEAGPLGRTWPVGN